MNSVAMKCAECDWPISWMVPPLPVLLQYARAAGVYVDTLIDDALDLPAKLPSFPKHEGLKRKASPKGKSKPQ
jgi:hypothetical protein